MKVENGKTILVTGATGGIGKATCEQLATEGCNLILAARSSGKLKAQSQYLREEYGVEAEALTVDMSQEVSVSSFAESLSKNFGSLDGVVIMPPQVASTNDCLPSPEAWREMFQNSFIGPLEILKAAIRQMVPDPASGRRAKIVIVSGISSAQVLGHYATSNVLRCAWLAEAKTLAFALGTRGIHVNTISLGGTLTSHYREAIEKRADNAGVSFEERLAEETSNVPLRKYGTPEEVARVISALLGPMSDHMTGHNLLHDGGFTRSY